VSANSESIGKKMAPIIISAPTLSSPMFDQENYTISSRLTLDTRFMGTQSRNEASKKKGKRVMKDLKGVQQKSSFSIFWQQIKNGLFLPRRGRR
jgi:hypothetical protein